MGKTKIVRKFVRDHPAEFNQRTGITRHPVVFFQMPPHPDEKIFFQEILNALGAPARGTASAQELQRLSRDLLMHMGARMLIIDEVHTLLAGTYGNSAFCSTRCAFSPQTCASRWSVWAPPTRAGRS